MTPFDELLSMEMIMPLVLSGIDCWQQKTETFWPRNPGFAGSSGASRASAPIAPPAKPGSKVAVIPSTGNRSDFRWGIHVVMVRLHLIHGRYTSGCQIGCQLPVSDGSFEDQQCTGRHARSRSMPPSPTPAPRLGDMDRNGSQQRGRETSRTAHMSGCNRAGPYRSGTPSPNAPGKPDSARLLDGGVRFC